MTQTIPVGIVVLAVLALALSTAITWARRDRYARPTPARLADMLGDFALTNLMIVMIAAAIIQVTVRFLLSRHIIIGWTEELAILCLIWLSFLAGAIMIRDGGHIAFEAICLLLPPRLQRANLVLVEIITIAVLVPIAWYGYVNARSLDIMMTVSLGLSLSAFAYVIPFAALLMIVFAVIQLIEHIRVPLPQTAERKADR